MKFTNLVSTSAGKATLGENGRRLLELGRRADYDLTPSCSARDTQRALHLAEELLRVLV